MHGNFLAVLGSAFLLKCVTENGRLFLEVTGWSGPRPLPNRIQIVDD